MHKASLEYYSEFIFDSCGAVRANRMPHNQRTLSRKRQRAMTKDKEESCDPVEPRITVFMPRAAIINSIMEV